MTPRSPTSSDVAYWEQDCGAQRAIVIGGPEEGDDVIPCPALVGVTEMGGHVVRTIRVAYEPDEIDVAALARGGTLWLTTWGGLPVHRIEVVPSEADRG